MLWLISIWKLFKFNGSLSQIQCEIFACIFKTAGSGRGDQPSGKWMGPRLPRVIPWARVSPRYHRRAPEPAPSPLQPLPREDALGLATRGEPYPRPSAAAMQRRPPQGLRRMRRPQSLLCVQLVARWFGRWHPTETDFFSLFICSVVSVSLPSYWLQHARLPCFPGACSNSCPLCSWCHLTVSSCVNHFSSC